MRPYHLFHQADGLFVYHAAAGRFIRVSPAAFELLELRRDMAPEEAEAEFLRRRPEEKGVLDEVYALEADGFFEPADPPAKDDAEFEAELAERFSGPCNTLVLSVSSGCNLACRYCYCGVCRDELPDKGLMDEATALMAVEDLFARADPKMDVRVTFFGGEPLLNKPVIRRVVARCDELAAERGMKAGYSITTNATLMDDETAAMIADRRFGLMVSIDGPRETHDRQCPTRDGRGSFSQVAAGIRVLMERGIRPTARCTMAHPAPNAFSLIRFLSDFGFSRVVLGTVYNPTFPSECDFMEEDDNEFSRCMEEEIIPWMVAERAAGRKPIYDPFDDVAQFQGEEEHPEKVPGLRCGACHGAMAVGPDGTLYPCHRFVGMKAWELGRLEGGADRGRCEDFWRRYRASMRETCGECWAYRICGGPCPWEVARSDGTFSPPNRRLCKETCNWVKQGVYYSDKAGSAGSPKGETK